MDTTEAEAAHVVALIREGLIQRNVATRLHLSRSAVRRVYKRIHSSKGRAPPEARMWHPYFYAQFLVFISLELYMISVKSNIKLR